MPKNGLKEVAEARGQVGAMDTVTESPVIVIDLNTPEDYAEWIKNFPRVWQMVDTDKAPLILTDKTATVIFPPKPYGVAGRIVREANNYFFIADDGQKYACVILTPPYNEALQLKDLVIKRIKSVFKGKGYKKYNNRLKLLA